jgi:phenylalanyl-tRNA synthetase beta chain
LADFDIKQPVFYAELDWKMMLTNMASRKVIFKEISKFPEMRRDLALVIDKQLQYQSIENIARKEGKPILKDIVLFDVYEGEKLAGKKSYAIGLTFSNDERTLTDTEVDAVMQKLMTRCENELGAVIRK